MKTSLLALACAMPLLAPIAAEARPVSIVTTLKPYSGEGAYLAIYLTDKTGNLVRTIHVAGGKAKYHKHLANWHRQGGGRLDGTTGASVGAGQTLRISTDIADSMIDAGFEIRVDTAVEDQRDIPADARIQVTRGSVGSPVTGRGYVKSLAIDM